MESMRQRAWRTFLKGLAYVSRALAEVHDVETDEGEVVCPTCLGAGGWQTDWEGGWMGCPTCGGNGTVKVPE